jgi:hypothetical protein
MNCNRYEEDLLIAYLFDEATEEEKRTIEEHLGSCEKCTQTLAELRGTVSTLQAWKDEELPRQVVLMPTRKEPARSRFRAPIWLRGLGWAAAAAVVALVITQGSIQYADGSLTLSFGRGGEPGLMAGMEEGRSTMTPTEVALSTSDSSSSTPRRTDLLPPTQGQMAYASMTDLDRAHDQSMSYVEQLFRASEERRAEEWRQSIEYLLTTVNEQRRRDMNELMMRIDAVGAGALGEIQMTNFRLDELASTVAPAGQQLTPPGQESGTPVQRQPVGQQRRNNN